MLPPTYYDPTVMNVPVTAADAAAAAAAPPSNTHAWKDGSFSFHDVLDALNPLQHIPVVSSIYRWLTGDEPGNVARIVGDGLYGGPIGLGAGLLSVAFKEETGKDPGEMAMAALTGEAHADVKLGTPAPVAAATAAVAAAAPSQAAPTSPAVAASVPAAAIQPVATPHPFLPLYAAAPAAPAPSAGSSAAEQAFLAQNAAYQRSIYGMRAPALPRPTTAPIPLQLTGAQLPMVSPPAAAPPVAPGEAAPPVNIPQKMMDALDKYARMQQQQQQQRGQQVDVAP